MNDPSKPRDERMLAAIALGKNPNSIGLASPASPTPVYLYTTSSKPTPAVPLTPPTPPPPPPIYFPVRQVSVGVSAPNPGGISLSMAAAMRMRLDIDLEGSYFKDGRIIVAGHRTSENHIDAALFLTALRASCEPGDPYFSLDADDGSAWLEEGRQLHDAISARLRDNLHLSTFRQEPTGRTNRSVDSGAA